MDGANAEYPESLSGCGVPESSSNIYLPLSYLVLSSAIGEASAP